jgi:hypothetical protein
LTIKPAVRVEAAKTASRSGGFFIKRPEIYSACLNSSKYPAWVMHKTGNMIHYIEHVILGSPY